jgi:hypothetical protein
MRNLAGHKVLLILRKPGGTCINIYGREQIYPPPPPQDSNVVMLMKPHEDNLVNRAKYHPKLLHVLSRDKY